jgi:putative component of toxin-antitoxin plasmid stabilization module
MKFRIVKLKQLSGEGASIYSVILDDDNETLFDKFINENKNSFLSELKDIFSRLKIIGNKTGARAQWFKEFEGKPGDGVCALYDDDKKKLRLYCVRYGSTLVILGGGGYKNVRSLQDNPKLKTENEITRRISKTIQEAMNLGEIEFTSDYYDFKGNFELNTEDYE